MMRRSFLRWCCKALALVTLVHVVTAQAAAPATRCPGDCNASGQVTVEELLTLVDIALGETLTATCTPGDLNSDGVITVDEILAAVQAALTGCLPTVNIIDFGPVFGGGPGSTTFVPLTLGADNIVTASFDLCFVDSMFTFSASESFAVLGAMVASTAVLDTCTLDDAQFPQGRLLHVEVTGDGTSPTLPSGQFLTLAFDSSPDASPGCYPVTLSATLHDTDNHQVTNFAKGVMTVFVFLGELCPSDCACLSTFCRDGVCCEEDCQGGTCNVPGSEGTCIRPANASRLKPTQRWTAS